MHFHFPNFVVQIFNPAAWQTEDFITSYASFWIKFVFLNRNLKFFLSESTDYKYAIFDSNFCKIQTTEINQFDW